MSARQRLMQHLETRRFETRLAEQRAEQAAEQLAAQRRDDRARSREEHLFELPKIRRAPEAVVESRIEGTKSKEKKAEDREPRGPQKSTKPKATLEPKILTAKRTASHNTNAQLSRQEERASPRRSEDIGDSNKSRTDHTSEVLRDERPHASERYRRRADDKLETRRPADPVRSPAEKPSAPPVAHLAFREQDLSPASKQRDLELPETRRPLSSKGIEQPERRRGQSLREVERSSRPRLPELQSHFEQRSKERHQMKCSPDPESAGKLDVRRTSRRQGEDGSPHFVQSQPGAGLGVTGRRIRKQFERPASGAKQEVPAKRLGDNASKHSLAPLRPRAQIAGTKREATKPAAHLRLNTRVRLRATATRIRSHVLARIEPSPRILPHPRSYVAHLRRNPLASIPAGGNTPPSATVPDPTFEAVATSVGMYPLPVQQLPALHTESSYILGPECTTVALRGINVTGFDGLTSAQTAAADLRLDDVALAVLHKLWGLNLVRIPISPQTIVSGNGSLSPDDMFSALDVLTTRLESAAIYTLIAIQAPPAGPTASPEPNDNTTAAIQAIASHFATSTSVLYEVFATSDPLGSGWTQQAQILIGAIRAWNSAAMIFVNTGNGGVDFSQLPLLFPTGEPVFNIVYTISAGAGNEPAPEEGVLAGLAEKYPVCATIWKDDPSGITPYVADVFGRYGIHWAASSWNDNPLLVANAGAHDFSATGWGLIVQRAANYPVRPFLQPLGACEEGSGSALAQKL
jgi:hypothetical protein